MHSWFPKAWLVAAGGWQCPGGVWPCSLVFQYAVPVVKYDRKGYKARARQLLLTQSSAIIVEDAKIKQRIDYSNLTGGNGTGLGLGTPLTLHLNVHHSKLQFVLDLDKNRIS